MKKATDWKYYVPSLGEGIEDARPIKVNEWSVAEDHAVVPREPTQAMIDAAIALWAKNIVAWEGPAMASKLYQAMVEAGEVK